MRNLKDKILYCLTTKPETRNSDIKLTNFFWIHYYPEKIFQNDKKEFCVRLLDLYDLPTEDSIKRVRAVIQNVDGVCLPTDENVRKQRKISEEKWREYLGYNN